MNLLFEAALEFQTFFREQKWQFCIIGGLAVIRWGEVRMTQDIDISLLTGFGSEEKYADLLLGKFQPRIDNARAFALENRVILLRAGNSVSVDIAFAALHFENEMIKRSSLFQYSDNCSLVTCSAEDLIVLKAFASRPQDWIDVEGIIMRQGSMLNTDYILKQITPLCEVKESPEILDKLKHSLKETKANLKKC